MPSTFSIVTDSSVDAQSLFDVSLSIDAHIESMAHSRERAIAGVTSGRIGLGETVTWRAHHFGIWFTMTSKITALDEPHSFIDAQVRGPFKTFIHRHDFEVTPGGSRMIDTITVASPIFGRLAEPLVLVPYLRRLIRSRNSALLEALP